MFYNFNLSTYILFFAASVAIIKIINTMKLVKDLISTLTLTRENLKRWKKGLINLNDIHDLTPREFEYWCGEFISSLGYTSIEQAPKGPDGGKDIICKLNGKKVYVECKQYSFDLNAQYIVDEQISKKLIGAMAHDKVMDGMIITSGRINSDSHIYINSLPKGYNVLLVDGEKLVNLYTNMHTAEEQKSA